MTKFNLCNLSKSQVASSKNTKEIFSGLRRFYLGRENRAVSDLVRVVAPSPPCSGKSRRLRLGRESNKKCFFFGRAVSALVAKVEPFPPRSRKPQEFFFWSRRLSFGHESRAVSYSVAKVWKWLRLVAPVVSSPKSQ